MLIVLFLHRHRKIFHSAEWMLVCMIDLHFPHKLIEITHALNHWGVGRPQPQNHTLPHGFPCLEHSLPAFLDLGHPTPTSALSELRALHRDPANKNPAEALHTTLRELCFPDPSLGSLSLGCQARFPMGANSPARLCVTELPPKWATRVYVQEQSRCHSHVWLTIQKTITVWHNPCICYFRGLLGRRWQRFRSQWSPSALQTRQDCWALFPFGSFPSISTLQVTPIGNSVSVSS